jgi:hypothetical protein
MLIYGVSRDQIVWLALEHKAGGFGQFECAE